MSLDPEHLRRWVGKRRSATDQAGAWPVEAMTATLAGEGAPTGSAAGAAPGIGQPLPPLWHWLYFLEARPAPELGPDGHAARGGFLPPVPLPRRMWAGGRVDFRGPIVIGEAIRKESEIVSVEAKRGKSGGLVFVTVRHSVFGAGTEPATVEEHDIVYREAAKPGESAAPPRPAPAHGAWRRTVRPDPVLLFRFSALTFNGHRIHYDQPYATGVEGYPGLIVHGPLQAMLLLELCRRFAPTRRLARFAYRALSPVFDTGPFTVDGDPAADGATAALWIADPSGGLAMSGTVGFA
jgi:3-methylfumaryl-CoA hydratase